MSSEVKQSYFNQAIQDKFLMVFDIPLILKDGQTQYNRNNTNIIPDSIQYSLYKTDIPDVTVKGIEVRNVGSTF